MISLFPSFKIGMWPAIDVDFDPNLIGRVFTKCSLHKSLLVSQFYSYTFLAFSILIDNEKYLGLAHLSTLIKEVKTLNMLNYGLKHLTLRTQ